VSLEPAEQFNASLKSDVAPDKVLSNTLHRRSCKDAIRSEDPIPAIYKGLWETARIKPAAGLTLSEESRNRTMCQIGG
jgi:hypothetical protein